MPMIDNDGTAAMGEAGGVSNETKPNPEAAKGSRTASS